ncbi:MAG: HD domain-containing protein [Sphingobacteriales bacterium JAD_PAG50586_3]|nr:MAG: HD domain-containing protein [Sphingobacteriales bacterium JAD_PAG50586_3]
MKKYKIINDPIYGFIQIPNDLVFALIEHPYFQRLRRIKQLGMTYLVYPGSNHTRFHHALGAMHLTSEAVEALRFKGNEITDDEANGVLIAVLLHDIGHGPFSHALESSIVSGIHHEELSALFMQRLNEEFDGLLTTAIDIFNDRYPKKFLHQLVSSQLDMDRLDYLSRDSFFSGVSEGVISYDRIIKMLDVVDDTLVVEAKGIYSVEKFIIARRLMYWQVYLHKTVLAAEALLVNILKRARDLAFQDIDVFGTTALKTFLTKGVTIEDFRNNPEYLDLFSQLDDYDIMASLKEWCNHSDRILAFLSRNLVNRSLFKIEIQNSAFNRADVQAVKERTKKVFGLTNNEISYFVMHDSITNSAYSPKSEQISIKYKDGTVKDIATASDQYNIASLTKTVQKYYLIYPKQILQGLREEEARGEI